MSVLELLSASILNWKAKVADTHCQQDIYEAGKRFSSVAIYIGELQQPPMECDWGGDSFKSPQGKECRNNGLIKVGKVDAF